MRTLTVAVLWLAGLVLVGCGQTQVQVTTGPFVFEMGQKLALELSGEASCPCTCEPITVAGFLVLDSQGYVVYDETVPSLVPSSQWLGVWNLVTGGGSPAPEGNYTVVVVTSLGDFRAEVRVTPPAQAPLVGRGKAKAAVCGVSLNVYRLLDEEDAGSSVSLRPGETLLVALPGNPTTGFGWEVREKPDFLTPIEGRDYRPSSDLIGAGGTFYFRYEVAALGTGTLAFVYRRPWEEVPPERTFTLQVTVP